MQKRGFGFMRKDFFSWWKNYHRSNYPDAVGFQRPTREHTKHSWRLVRIIQILTFVKFIIFREKSIIHWLFAESNPTGPTSQWYSRFCRYFIHLDIIFTDFSYFFLDSRYFIDSQHSLFPFDNYELEHTRWEDDIIWDSANMPSIPSIFDINLVLKFNFVKNREFWRSIMRTIHAHSECQTTERPRWRTWYSNHKRLLGR